MGSCMSQSERPTFHERFSEHDDNYFARVETRNSFESKSKWWRKYRLGVETSPLSENDSFWGQDHSCLVVTDDDSTFVRSPFSAEAVLASPNIAATGTTAASGASARSSILQGLISGATPPMAKTFSSQRTFDERNVQGWQVRRQGHALQLRLAKHRFLQLAAGRRSSYDDEDHEISPLSLDSSFFPPTQYSVNNNEGHSKAKIDFNSSNGMVWKEIVREHKVTAVALSRKFEDYPVSPPRKLLLAMGDENGMVLLTQLLDDAMTLHDSRVNHQTDAIEFTAEGRIRSLDFGDHQSLVAGGDGCCAWILRIVFNAHGPESLIVIHRLERIDRIYSNRFSRDFHFLAVGGFDGRCAVVPMASVWKEGEPESGNDIDSLQELMKDSTIELDRPGLIHCLDWGPEYLAVADNKHCAFYDASTFDLVHETPRRLTTIQAMHFNDNGSFLAIGEREVIVLEGRPPFRIHCEISNMPKHESKVSQFRYRITALSWSPSGSFLAIAGSDGVCLVVETKSFALVHQIQRTNSIASMAWQQNFLAVSDDACRVALVKAGNSTNDSISDHDDYSSTASSSKLYSAGATDWVLRDDAFRDLEDVDQHVLPQDIKSQSNITALAFSRRRNSSYLAFAADDCSLTIMTTRDWKAVFQIEFAKPIKSLAFSHSNNFLAMGGEEAILYVLSVPTRSMILNTIMSSPIHSVAFSRNDERLSIGQEDGVLSLLVVDAEFEPTGEIDGSESPVLCHDWSFKTLAVGREDGTVTLFDTEKAFCNFFVPLAEFISNYPVRSLSFGVSERFLAIGGDNGIFVLSRKGGWALCHHIYTSDKIFTTRWSPAGRYLALAGTNDSFQVYDTISWVAMNEVKQALASTPSGRPATVACLDWSLDCRWMAVGSMGSGIIVLSTTDWKRLGPSSDGLSLSPSNESAE